MNYPAAEQRGIAGFFSDSPQSGRELTPIKIKSDPLQNLLRQQYNNISTIIKN